MADDVGEPFAARVFALDRLVCDAVGDDEEDLGEVGVVGPEHDGVVAAKRRRVSAGVRVGIRTALGSNPPLDEVAQEVEGVDRLLLVLVERQPAQPMREDLVHVDALRAEPHELSNGGDAVFRGVDVLLGARVRRLDDRDQQGERLCSEKPATPSAAVFPKEKPQTTFRKLHLKRSRLFQVCVIDVFAEMF